MTVAIVVADSGTTSPGWFGGLLLSNVKEQTVLPRTYTDILGFVDGRVIVNGIFVPVMFMLPRKSSKAQYIGSLVINCSCKVITV
jgi:hypothetical protein